eukprot:8745242-Pyramimonas_sp.AAC.2
MAEVAGANADDWMEDDLAFDRQMAAAQAQKQRKDEEKTLCTALHPHLLQGLRVLGLEGTQKYRIRMNQGHRPRLRVSHQTHDDVIVCGRVIPVSRVVRGKPITSEM